MPIPGSSSSSANNGINEKVSVNDEDEDGSRDIFISIYNNHNLNSYVKLRCGYGGTNLMTCKQDYYWT